MTDLVYFSKTCGDCAHWQQHQKNINDLGTPTLGDCREQIHVLAIPVQTLRGMAIQTTAAFATTPKEFPACGRFVDAEKDNE